MKTEAEIKVMLDRIKDAHNKKPEYTGKAALDRLVQWAWALEWVLETEFDNHPRAPLVTKEWDKL